MKTIYKYELTGQVVQMPAGAQILHVGEQQVDNHHCALFVWAKVDTEAPMVGRAIEVIGTGWRGYGGTGVHVGTVQSGGLVWHVFDHGETVEGQI